MFVDQVFLISIINDIGRKAMYEVSANTEAAAVEMAIADYVYDFNDADDINHIEAVRYDFVN
jgi:hypothetical protein